MINLQEYLYEAAGLDKETKAAHKEIKAFLKENYRAKTLDISDEKNEDGKFEVTVKKGEVEFIGKGESLVNDLFVWGALNGSASFIIGEKCNVTSLVGGPSAVGWNYTIAGGNPQLKSLVGIATNIGRKLFIGNCPGLENLEGCEEVDAKDIELVGTPVKDLQGLPDRVTGKLRIANCDELEDLNGCPRMIKDFVLRDLKSLKSLKGAPNKIFGDYVLRGCPELESEDVVVDAKNRSVFDNAKLDADEELLKQQAAAAREISDFQINGKSERAISVDTLASALGFNSVEELLSSKNPLLKQYVIGRYEVSLQSFGREVQKRISDFRIYMKGDFSGWDKAAEARAVADEKGMKKSKSNIKTAGAKTNRNIDFMKFGDLCRGYLSMIERGKSNEWCFDDTSVTFIAV